MSYGNMQNQATALFEKLVPGLAFLKAKTSIESQVVKGKPYTIKTNYLRQKVLMSDVSSLHNSVDGGNIGEPNTPDVQEMKVYPRVWVGSLGISEMLSLAESDGLKGDKGGAAAVSKFFMKSFLKTAVAYDNFMLCRSGDGVVSNLGATVSGATITVTDPRLILEGKDYEIRDAADPTVIHATFKVKNKATSPNALGAFTITLVTPIAANGQAAGDYISWGTGDGSSYGRAVTGLSAMVDDSASVFQGLNVANYPQWTSYVDDNGGTVRNPTSSLFRKLLAAIAISGDDGNFQKVKRTWLMCKELQSEFEEVYESALHLTPGTKSVGIGAGSANFKSALGECTFASLKEIPYDTAFLLDPTEIHKLVWSKMVPRRGTMNQPFEATPGVLVKNAEFFESFNYMIVNRHTSARVDNLQMTPVSSRAF